MKTKFIITLIFLLGSFYCRATDTLQLIKQIPIKARLLSSDPLGNIYVVKDNNTLLRFSEDGDSLGAFNEIKKGNVSQIDATNPLKVLLFFADYNQVVVLNNMLTQKNVLRLNSIGLNNTKCIANSADGNLWIYDEGIGSILKVDEQLNILQNTNLRIVGENPSNAIFMMESDRNLYLSGENEGVRAFDTYGFYYTTYHLPVDNFQVMNHQLVYINGSNLIAYDIQRFNEKKLALPQSSDIQAVRFERNRVYILRKEELDIYQLNAR